MAPELAESAPATGARANGQRPGRVTPGPASRRVAWQLLTRPNLLEVFDELEPYGDVIRWTLAGKPFYALRSPRHVERVLIAKQADYGKSSDYELLSIGLGKGLLTNEGESWTSQRRLMQPLFAKRRLDRFGAGIKTAIAALLDDWERRYRDGDRVDVAAAMNELALEILGRALFGANLSGQSARLRDAVLTGLRGEVAGSRLQLVVSLPRPLVASGVRLLFRAPLPLKSLRRLRDALATIDDVVGGMIAERRAAGEPGSDDLLGLLLAARDEAGRPLSDRQVRDELVTFLIAGSETLATGLAWMWHLLGDSPQARERLIAEVDDVLGAGSPGPGDAERLVWTSAVFQEALRLRPPVWVFDRKALVDDEFDGHPIPAGATVLIPAWLIHRDPRVWHDPDAFEPGRFMPGRATEYPRGAYLPFGAGRRVCIGAGFAMLEATLITAMVAQRFRLDNIPGHTVTPETTVILRPRHGLPMTVRRR